MSNVNITVTKLYESNAQKCMDKLTDELLGKDFYIVSSVGGNQAR